MNFSDIYQRAIFHPLVGLPVSFDEAHVVLSTAGRLVLTIAATLFLAYVALMTAALLLSMVRGWTHAVLDVRKGAAIAPRRPSALVAVKQS